MVRLGREKGGGGGDEEALELRLQRGDSGGQSCGRIGPSLGLTRQLI